MGLKISSKPPTRRLFFFKEMFPITFHLICPVNGWLAVYPMAGKTQTQERTLLVSISQTQVLNSFWSVSYFSRVLFHLSSLPYTKRKPRQSPNHQPLMKNPRNSTWKPKFRISKKGVSFSKGLFSGSMLKFSGSMLNLNITIIKSDLKPSPVW